MKKMKKKTPDSESFKKPTDLAEAYLKGNFSLPIRSSMVESFFKTVKWNGLPPFEKAFLTGFKEVLDKIKRENISESALKELEKDYNKKTVNRVLEALTDFELFIRTDRLVNVVDYKRKRREEREYGNILRATEYLLQSPLVLDSEKRELQQIKSGADFHMWQLKGCKKVTVTPVKEFLLNKEATPCLLTTPDPEKYIEEAFERLNKDIVYVRPNGKPKKIFENALISVIYKLLKRDVKQIKEVYCLTAEVVKRLIPEATYKHIDNALKST